MVSSLPSRMAGIRSTLFEVYRRQEIAPYFTADEKGTPTGRTSEILEKAIFASKANTSLTDFWRIAPGGFATHIAGYREDRMKSLDGLDPKKWFWPARAIREVYELVVHAMVLSEKFEHAESVEFRCEWRGLADRTLSDVDVGMPWLPGLSAHENERVVVGEWSVDDLKQQPDIVAQLVGPLMRSFDPSFRSRLEWVGQQIVRF